MYLTGPQDIPPENFGVSGTLELKGSYNLIQF